MLTGPSLIIRQFSSCVSFCITGLTKSEYHDSLFVEMKLSLLVEGVASFAAACIVSISLPTSSRPSPVVVDSSLALGVSKQSLTSYLLICCLTLASLKRRLANFLMGVLGSMIHCSDSFIDRLGFPARPHSPIETVEVKWDPKLPPETLERPLMSLNFYSSIIEVVNPLDMTSLLASSNPLLL